MQESGDYKYWAFISYSHQDKAWGDWLHKKLETYRVPRRLVGQPHRDGSIPRRLFPIFRDRDELPSHAELGAVINEALRKSRHQIVICSPRAAQSKWVNEEIKYFKSLGRDNRVLALIVDGVPNAADSPQPTPLECFPPSLRFRLDSEGKLTQERTHPVAADAREGKDGPDAAKLKLIAGLLGVSYDDLKQREKQRRFWRHVQIAAAGLLALSYLIGGWRWYEQREAKQALDAHIEKVYDLGRRELLDHHEARAAVDLNEAYKLGRDTPALRFMLGQAMQPLDARSHIRVDAGGQVRRTAFSPDGRTFVTAAEVQVGSNAFVGHIWNVRTGARLASLAGMPPQTFLTRYFPDSNRVLASGVANPRQKDARTGVWEASSGRQLATLPGHVGLFGQPFDASGSILVTAAAPNERAALVWDAHDFRRLRTLECGSPVRAVGISADGAQVLTGDASGRTCLWRTKDGRLMARLSGRTSAPISAVLFTPNGSRALAFSEKGDVRVWSTRSSELLLAFAADPFFVYDAKVDSAGTRLVTVGQRGYKVWDLERGSLQASREGDGTIDSSADISPDGTVLAIADGRQARAEMLHLPGGRLITTLEPGGGAVSAASYRSDGRQLLLASSDGMVSIWNTPIKKLLEVSHPPVVSSALMADNRVITAGLDGSLRAWDIKGGAMLRSVREHSSPLTGAAVSPDGRRVASVAIDGTVELRDSSTLDLIMHGSLGNGWAYDLISFSPDSSMLAAIPGPTGAAENAVFLWAADNGLALGKLIHPCRPRGLRFASAGAVAITGCEDGVLRLWDTKRGILLRTYGDGGKPTIGLGLSADNTLVGTASDEDDHVSAWNLATGAIRRQCSLPRGDPPFGLALDSIGRYLAVGAGYSGRILLCATETSDNSWLSGHSAPVQGMQFLASGLLLSYRSDDTLRIWDAERGEQIAEAGNHSEAVFSADVSADETRLLSGAQDGTAVLWDIRSEKRSAAEIAALLDCRSPWHLNGDSLLPASGRPAKCN